MHLLHLINITNTNIYNNIDFVNIDFTSALSFTIETGNKYIIQNLNKQKEMANKLRNINKK